MMKISGFMPLISSIMTKVQIPLTFSTVVFAIGGFRCSEVKLGIRVCTRLDLGDNGRHYFDAVVEGVMTFKGVVIKEGVSMVVVVVVLGWENGVDRERAERGWGRMFNWG